jgi:hypothetical protein
LAPATPRAGRTVLAAAMACHACRRSERVVARASPSRQRSAVARSGPRGGVFERLHLTLAAHELREAPSSRELKVNAQGPSAHHLVHLDRGMEPFHRLRSQRPELEVALAQSLRRFTDRDRSRRVAVALVLTMRQTTVKRDGGALIRSQFRMSINRRYRAFH